MFGIAAGSFGVMITAASGELVQCHVLRRGVWFGLGPILTNGPRSLTYRAMEASHAMHVAHVMPAGAGGNVDRLPTTLRSRPASVPREG